MSTLRIVALGTLMMLALAGCGAAPTAPVAMETSATAFEAERAYKIEDTLGIGPVYGEKLRKLGITNTDKLLAASQTRLARKKLADEAGIPYKLVLAWAQKTEIMTIHGIGPRQSNLLNAIFVRSVKDLGRRDPKNLHERLAIANTFKPKFVDRTPSLATVTKWVEAAKVMPTAISDDL